MVDDFTGIKGELQIDVYDINGNLKTSTTVPNLVVTSGKNAIAAGIGNGSTTVMAYMAVGTSATTPVITDLTLTAELARVALTSTVVTGNTVTYTATFGAGVGTGGLQEGGLFSASTGGIMLSHATFALLTKNAADVVTITWTITLG